MAEAVQPKEPAGHHFWKGVATITALITAVTGLIAVLAGIGVFDGDDEAAPPTSDVASPTVSTAGELSVQSETQPPEPARADVLLTYAGDAEGCGLLLSIEIGDRTYTPTSNSYWAEDVLSGQQSYAVGGTITCPFAGQCQASGSGTIDVAEARSYPLVWAATAVGQCDVVLANG